MGDFEICYEMSQLFFLENLQAPIQSGQSRDKLGSMACAC